MRSTEEVREELELVRKKKQDLEDFIYQLMEELERIEQEEKSKEYMKELWETVDFAKDKLNE